MNGRCSFLFLLMSVLQLEAQESHYWTMQYGARSTLLGGAVVCGEPDNSALFYNPAALSFIRTSALTVNADAYRYHEVRQKDGAGEDLDLFSKRMLLFPQMSSGLITKDPYKPYRIGFAVLTRYFHNVDISQRYENYGDLDANYPGQEYYVGSVDLRNIFSDTWIGMGGSYKLSDHLSIGTTLFFSYRNHRYNSALSTRMSYEQPGAVQLSAYRYQDEIRVNTLQLIPKVGLHGRWGIWRWGMTLTLPSMGIWGEGRVNREISFQNLQGNSDVILSDQQRKLPARYQYPISIATGLGVHFQRAYIGISGEFFAGIPLYRMVTAEPRSVVYPTNLSTGAIDFLSVWHYAKPVLNGAIGYEQAVHEKLRIHLGFRTDFSYRYALPKQLAAGDLPHTYLQKTMFLLPSIDMFHLSAGASWMRPNSWLTFGLDGGWGYRARTRPFTNFHNPEPNRLLQGEIVADTPLSIFSITFLVGYTYFFALQ